tara:strand:- start:893 stop:1135 length:243 start_codon:yes stop_codon:yes gene_type:complete
MKKMFDNKFMVFQVAEGPKIIIEALNTQGNDGWEAHSMITVGEDKIVVFLKRESTLNTPDPKKSEADKVDKLWAEDSGKE